MNERNNDDHKRLLEKAQAAYQKSKRNRLSHEDMADLRAYLATRPVHVTVPDKKGCVVASEMKAINPGFRFLYLLNRYKNGEELLRYQDKELYRFLRYMEKIGQPII